MRDSTNYKITQRIDGVYQFEYDADFQFQLGGKINPLILVYETYGKLSPKKDNVVVIHHALSPSHHVHSTEKNVTPGWWEEMIGPDRALDTNRYFIISINNLASCYGSSSPSSINLKTDKPYRYDFPVTTMRDIVNSQKLLLDCLGISEIYAIVGNSMGAMISLEWVIQYPKMVKNLISTSSCYKAYPSNIANRVVQREIIQLDPAWQRGFYQENPIAGLKLARKLGHFTYRNPNNLNEKFKNNEKKSLDIPCEVEEYLEHNATKFVSHFDANCYLYLLNAMDLFDVTRDFANAKEAFSRITSKVLIISVDSDVLFTPEQQQDLYQAMKNANVKFINHHSSYGHDTFLVEISAMTNYIRDFLR